MALGTGGKMGSKGGATGGKRKSKVDLAKLFSTMDGRSGGDRFKLDTKGTVRFRLLMPLGNDDMPMIPADEHWLPYVREDGKEGKRQAYCYDLAGQVCPFCILSGLLQNSRVAALEDMGKDIRPGKRWLMYVINRSYMITQDEPHVVDSMEKVEKAPLPQTVAQAIVSYFRNRSWGDPTDPVTGYDFEVTGKPRGGKASFVEYSVSPVPRDGSPEYNPKLAANFQPLTTLLEFKTDDDCMKLIEPILATLSTEGFEAVVEAFWEEMGATSDGGDADADVHEDEADDAGAEEEALEAEVEETEEEETEEEEPAVEGYGTSVRADMEKSKAKPDVEESEDEDETDESEDEEDEVEEEEVPSTSVSRKASGAPRAVAGKRRSPAAVTMEQTTDAKLATPATQEDATVNRGSRLLAQLRKNKK